MGFDLNKLRQDVKQGTINPAGSGQGGPKVGEGAFKVVATKAEFGSNTKTNKERGLIEFKVLEVLDNRGELADEAIIGATFNHYLPINPADYLAENIALVAMFADIADFDIWAKLEALEPETEVETLAQMLNLLNTKFKGKVIVEVDRQLQKNSDKYYNNKFSEVGSAEANQDADAVEEPVAAGNKDDMPF